MVLGLPGPLPLSMAAAQALGGRGIPGGVHTIGWGLMPLDKHLPLPEPSPGDTRGPSTGDVTAWRREGHNRELLPVSAVNAVSESPALPASVSWCIQMVVLKT